MVQTTWHSGFESTNPDIYINTVKNSYSIPTDATDTLSGIRTLERSLARADFAAWKVESIYNPTTELLDTVSPDDAEKHLQQSVNLAYGEFVQKKALTRQKLEDMHRKTGAANIAIEQRNKRQHRKGVAITAIALLLGLLTGAAIFFLSGGSQVLTQGWDKIVHGLSGCLMAENPGEVTVK